MDSSSPIRMHPDAYHLMPGFDEPLQPFMDWMDAHPEADPLDYPGWQGSGWSNACAAGIGPVLAP